MTNKSLYDCIEPGMIIELGSYTFERDEIIEFATEFDPQAFHLSDEGAAASHFGKLCASGWHTISVWMRLNVDHAYAGLIEAAGYQGPQPVFGPSPGVRNIKWLLPVFAGDTITYRSETIGTRPSKNLEGWGMLMLRTTGWNQDGKQVLTKDGAVNMRMD